MLYKKVDMRTDGDDSEQAGALMKGLARVGVFGGVGGAINAALCYANFPVPIVHHANGAWHVTFAWHVIPAGAIHGCVLAAAATYGAHLLRGCRRAIAVLGCVLVGWLAGAVSWIPLNRSFGASWLKSLTWPLQNGVSEALLAPLQCFGFVACLYCLGLIIPRGRHSVLADVLIACASGVVGSLWLWSEMKAWYLSPLHGTIWGIAVGIGPWATSRVQGAT